MPLVPGVALLFAGAGCQSTKTDAGLATVPDGKPNSTSTHREVIVHDFLFEGSQLHTEPGLLENRPGPAKRIIGQLHPAETPVEKATRLSGLLSETVAQELTKLEIPASRRPRTEAMPGEAIVIDGEFLEVEEGNRLRRAIVGFRAGSTEVLVQVSIYDLRQSRDVPILVYGAGTASKPMPGALVTWNPYVMAAKYVLSRGATEKHVSELGKRIAKDIAQLEGAKAPER